MSRFFDNLYKYVIGILFLVIIAFLCFYSYTTTCYISVDYHEYTFFLSDKIFRNVLIEILFIVLLFIISKIKYFKKIFCTINTDKKIFLILKYVLLAIILAISVYWVLSTRFFPYADQYAIQQAVVDYKSGDYSMFEVGGYISAYGSLQLGLFVLSYLFSLLFGEFNIVALELMNTIAVFFIYKSLSEIVGKLGGNHTTQLATILIGLAFPVLSLYCYFIYGNIIGMAFGLTAVKYELEYFNNNKISHAIISSLFIMLAIMAKSTYLIYLIGMVIFACFKIIETKKIKLLFIIAMFLFTTVFQSFVPKKIIEDKIGFKINEGITFLAYTAMGLQESERCEGWYNGFNNDTYYGNKCNANKQKEISIDSINNRIAEFEKDSNYCEKFFNKKILSEWNNPTFQVFWNISDKFSDYYPSQEIIDFLQVKSTFKIQKILNVVHFIILTGALFFIFNTIKDERKEMLVLPLIFIGGFMFYSLLSEAKAQYTIMFFVLLIPCSIIGYKDVLNKLSFDSLGKIVKNPMFILTVIIIVFLSIQFTNKTKDYLTTDDNLYYKYVVENGNFDYLNPPEYY